MLRIDNALLQEIGLGGLSENEKNSLLKHIYDTLEMRVGMRLADQMTNEQLDEFESYYEAKDDAGAFKWLETNFPNYKDIVQDEFDKLKAEVAQSAPQILSTSQAQAGAVPAAAGPDPLYPSPSPMPTQPQAQPVAPPSVNDQTVGAATNPTLDQPQTMPPANPAPQTQPQPPVSQPLNPNEPPFPSQQPPPGPSAA